MQSSDISSAKYIDKDNSDLSRAISLGNTSDIAESTNLTKSEGVQSDPEEQTTKTKTQSRFSSAIRKLSGSTKKKKSSAKKKDTKDKELTTDNVLSSGGEDTLLSGGEDSGKKHKNKLTKHFRIGSLGKSKRSVDDEEIKNLNTIAEALAAAKSIEISRTREVTSEHEHTIRTPEISPPTSVPGSPRRLDRIQKVQITISGKKIEHTKIDKKQRSITTTTTQITGGSRSATDYLIPSTATGETATTTTTTAYSVSPTPLANIGKLQEETLAVTENTAIVKKDKKPKGKKPIDATLATTVTKTTSTTATRLTDLNASADLPSTPTPTTITHTQTATTETTKPTKTTSERLVIITQSKYDKAPIKPSEQTAPPKPSRSSEITASNTPSTHTAATLKLPATTKKLKSKNYQPLEKPATGSKSKSKGKTEIETKLMQNPSGTPQRGHRFPKPATTANTTTETATTSSSSVEKTAIEKPIEFQLQSHASQQAHSSQSTGPPSYSPPPIPASSPAKETRYTSSLLIEPKTTTTTTTVTLAPLANISEAVNQASDDKVSSAESVLPKDYTEQSRVQFAVGSAVRPQPKLVSLDIDLDQQLDSVGSNLSSDSATPLSDSSRKRIRYIAEPSLTEEELLILTNRRAEELGQHNKYSLDSDYEYDTVDNQHMPAFGDLSMDQEMEPTIMTSANAEKREHLYKILVIGELGTGKTSFIKRYVHQFFSQNYRATIGVDFALKVLHWDANTIVRLQLWDIAGQERFGNMTRVYYKEAVGAFIVFDVTRSGTFDCVSKWKEDLDSKVQLPDGSPIPCILLANKCDQDKQGIVTSPEKMEEYCKENGFSGWYETSAKENINIDEAARALVNKILLNDKLINAADLADNERFNLNNTGDQMSTEPKSKCAC